MGLLDGKAAVVTGAAQGIGLEIARTFVREGASIALGDINGAAAEKSAGELAAEGATVIAVRCDVTEEAEVEALVGARWSRSWARSTSWSTTPASPATPRCGT